MAPTTADPIATWLLLERSPDQTAEALIEALAQRLVAEGYPLWRLRVAVLAMHPEVYARALHWRRGQGVRVEPASFDLLSTPSYVGSPVEAVHKGAGTLRCRLDVPLPELRYVHLTELRANGGTDYAIFPLIFGDGRRTFLSIASDASEGFTDAQIERFERLLPLITLRLELESATYSTRTLLHTYLGRNAAERVIEGSFRRGTGQLIHAAIWMCDLRGFTSLVDRTAVRAVIPILDQYFACVAKPVTAHGGEILKFIGDAMLAVFPVNEDPGRACRSAVEAAREALRDFEAHEVALRYGLRIGVAVNLGEVVYGNIGASDRLDFTVIGAAVNEVARMEAACKTLNTPLVISANVAAQLPPEQRHSLGEHTLRGVSAPRELFSLRELLPSR